MPFAAIPFPDFITPFLFQIPAFEVAGLTIGPLGLRWYALGYITGILFTWWSMLRMVGRPELWGSAPAAPFTRDDVDDFLFYATLGVLLGGRIGSVLLYNPQMLSDPLSILRIWEGGMSFHGGFAGVCLAVIGVAMLRKVPLLRLADAVAVTAPVGIGLVRLANFVNQELWGRPTDLPWAFIFDTDPTGLPRHPSQLYEAFLEGLVLFVILQVLVHRFKALSRPGVCAGVFITGYSVFRMLVEQVREPDAELIFGLTRGTAYSLPMLGLGLAFLFIALSRRRADASPA
jgi:phosphatidylglycerol---prolipoprotein diacylglyceryl transferase